MAVLDWKCVITLYDKSINESDPGVDLNVFRPENLMPQVGPADVVILTTVKVQDRAGVSLLSNRATKIFVYEAAKIPPYPKSAREAQRQGDRGPLHPLAEAYASWLYHSVDKSLLPDATSFKIQASQSLNVREKFSLLEDVRQHTFHDLVVQVIKEPFDGIDKVTLWTTDYTENQAFFHFSWGGNQGGSIAGDPLGYTTGKGRQLPQSNSRDHFSGPFGKKCLQITCYEPHASSLRGAVSKGTYVRLRNVQIKFGSNSNNLEGFLREDRGSYGHKLQVEHLDPNPQDVENVDARFKALLLRQRRYEKEMKAELRTLREANAGQKRPASDEPQGKKINSKTRRQMERARAFEKAEKSEQAINEAKLELNEHSKAPIKV